MLCYPSCYGRLRNKILPYVRQKVGVTMRVLLNDHLYDMDRKQFDGVLKVATKAVKHGIYEVDKVGTAEMKKETYSNREELKKSVAEYEENGFKVYYNV